jgi:hypothetical protein
MTDSHSPRLVVAVALVVSLSGCLAVAESAFGAGGVVESAPVEVSPAGLTATGYAELNRTDVLVRPPLPLVPHDRTVQVRAWVAVYGTGFPDAPDGASSTAADSVPRPVAAGDSEDAAVVTVASVSALEAGPVALNPLVYATDPRLLSSVGPLVEFAEFWLAGDLVDLTVEESEQIRVLGRETSVSRLGGRLVAPTGESVDVRLSLVSVVHDGDLVVAVGVFPNGSDEDDAAMQTLVAHLRHGE